MKKTLLALAALSVFAVQAEPLTVAATPVPHAEILEFLKPALAEQGVELDVKVFTDYVQPNVQVAEGRLDANFFQHQPYLDEFNASKGTQLVSVAGVHVEPFGAYSSKHKSLNELPQGANVVIPNDATNGGRALKVLETTGLIAVDPEAGYLPEVSDITENKLNLEFVEVEAAQTAGLLPDVAAAFINGGHAVDNGYFPAKDAILIETVAEGSDNPYVNILVARTADKDNPLYQRILEVYHTDEVAEIFATAYKGAYLPAWK